MSALAAAIDSWHDGQWRHAQFFAEGMHCANCVRTLTERLQALPGINEVTVNLATSRVNVSWQPLRLDLDTVLDQVRQLGYQPIPLSGEQNSRVRQLESRRLLKRLGLAALGSMQLMMYAVGLYAARDTGIDAWQEQLLRVTSMIITLPVLLYSGAPFLRGAWRDLSNHSLGMDVPVAAALLLAFAASVFNTLRGSGEIYFDSVAMFVLFLLAGRYLEQRVRRGSLEAGEALARSLPSTVTRKGPAGIEPVPLQAVAVGDLLLIAQGAVVPVDGYLQSALAQLDESLISGESAPVSLSAGALARSGAVNLGQTFELVASRNAGGSTLASMVALMDRAWRERPRIATAAERAAAQFIAWILVLALAVAAFWWWVDAPRAFPATLAVLVVTCPCALSLATPMASAAAGLRLARRGVLVTRPDALERMAIVNTVVLDKTGTLTTTTGSTLEVRNFGALPEARVLALARALEQYSTHPLARRLQREERQQLSVTEVRETAGQGIEGVIDGVRWRIGTQDYAVGEQRDAAIAEDPLPAGPGCFLGRAGRLEAYLYAGEHLRAEAAQTSAQLQQDGLSLVMATGDRLEAARPIANALGIRELHAALDPQGKLRLVKSLQAEGRKVLMVGDGINDGPVLAAADASVAMGAGAAIAQSAADVVLMNESLSNLRLTLATARAYAQVVKANLRWALGYNIVAVPLAAAGLAPPWAAALGMSFSSLYVSWRAQRLAGAAP